MQKLLTPKQLSDALQVGISTIYQWAHYGFVTSVKVGSAVRFNEKDIDRWLKQGQRKGMSSLKLPVNP